MLVLQVHFAALVNANGDWNSNSFFHNPFNLKNWVPIFVDESEKVYRICQLIEKMMEWL